jgi:FkbM family methyltransferase
MVSSYCSSEQPLSEVPEISLGELLRDYAAESVDLLKIDCEGGEYAILENSPAEVFRHIRNIVFDSI